MTTLFALLWFTLGAYILVSIANIVNSIKSNKISRKHIEAINRYTDTVVKQNEYLKKVIGVKPKEE